VRAAGWQLAALAVPLFPPLTGQYRIVKGGESFAAFGVLPRQASLSLSAKTYVVAPCYYVFPIYVAVGGIVA
jgi:hypothetical protein